MPHWANLTLILLGPPAAVVFGVLTIAWRSRSWERNILAGAAIVSVSLLGLGIFAWLISGAFTDAPLVTVRNDAPWSVEVQVNDEEPIELARGESHSFTEPESPIPGGYGVIDRVAVTGGSDVAQKVVIEGNTGHQHAAIVVRAVSGTAR